MHANARDIRDLGREDPLEEGMAAHSSVLAWRIPWTEEPGRLQSIRLLLLLLLSRYSHALLSAILWTVSPPGSSVLGILQARILEWAAMPSSRGFSEPRDLTHISYVSCIGRQVLYH